MKRIMILFLFAFTINSQCQNFDSFFKQIGNERTECLKNIVQYQREIIYWHFNNNIDDYLRYFSSGQTSFDSSIFRNVPSYKQAILSLNNNSIFNELIVPKDSQYISDIRIEIPPSDLNVNFIDSEPTLGTILEDEIIIGKRNPNTFYLDEYLENPEYVNAWRNSLYGNYNSQFFTAFSNLDVELKELQSAISAAGQLPITLIASGILCSNLEMQVKAYATAIYLTSNVLLFNDRFNGNNGFELIGHKYYGPDNTFQTWSNCGDYPIESKSLPKRFQPPVEFLKNPSPTINEDFVANGHHIDAHPDAFPQPFEGKIETIIDFYRYIKEKISFELSNGEYPKLQNSTESNRIYILFTIDKTGNPINYIVERSSNSNLNDEAIYLCKKAIPKFSQPALKNETPVNFSFTAIIKLPTNS